MKYLIIAQKEEAEPFQKSYTELLDNLPTQEKITELRNLGYLHFLVYSHVEFEYTIDDNIIKGSH